MAQEVPVFALLPGSRQAELALLGDLFVKTAKLIRKKLPNAQFVVPLTTRETRLQFEMAIYNQQASDVPFRLLFGHAQDALGAADVSLVASGTAFVPFYAQTTGVGAANRTDVFAGRVVPTTMAAASASMTRASVGASSSSTVDFSAAVRANVVRQRAWRMQDRNPASQSQAR
jgi:lipid A disaccharide synthetase